MTIRVIHRKGSILVFKDGILEVCMENNNSEPFIDRRKDGDDISGYCVDIDGYYITVKAIYKNSLFKILYQVHNNLMSLSSLERVSRSYNGSWIKLRG